MRFTQKISLLSCGVALALFAGCSAQEDTRTFSDQDSAEADHAHEHAHDHAHEHGPNGGHLLEVGEEQYHVEVVFDEKGRTLTAFILGPDAKTAYPIAGESIDFDMEIGDKEHEIPLEAKPLEGEKDGKSSRFVAEGKAVPESIKKESDLNGHFHLDIGDDHFHVDLKHDDHEGHDHAEHDHKHEKDEPKKEDAKKAEEKPADKE